MIASNMSKWGTPSGTKSWQSPSGRVYAIVDGAAHAGFGHAKLLNKIVLETEIPIIQLRFKKASPAMLFKWIDTAGQLKQVRPFKLIVNDVVSTLDSPLVDGVHLGQDDGDFARIRDEYPDKILGLSTHNLEEALQAEKLGADYIGCGCVFPTETKTDVQPLGIAGLAEICKTVTLPTVAIGGITPENIEKVWQAGANMAAMATGLIYEFHA